MLLKDQLKIRMDEMGIGVNELARRVGVSSQTVRNWTVGRNFPTKAKCNLIENSLTFKLDFSEGTSEQSLTMDAALRTSGAEAFINFSKLTPAIQVALGKLVDEVLAMQTQSRESSAFMPPSMTVEGRWYFEPTHKGDHSVIYNSGLHSANSAAA